MQPDWAQCSGNRTKIRFMPEISPIAADPTAYAGPGARRKDAKGEWLVTGEHELDRRLRDGERLTAQNAAAKK